MKSFFNASDEDLIKKFNNLTTPRQVAEMLEIEYSALIYYLYKIPKSDQYTEFSLKKRSGNFRTITAPASPLKLIQKKLSHILMLLYQVKAPAHGYLPNKSIVTNAKMHLRKRYVLNIDLEDFFPSITFKRVRGLFMAVPYERNKAVASFLATICCYDNVLPQGAPSSPIISNMICSKMDAQLRKLAVKNRCVYTRYADDLTFSTSLKDFPESLAIISPSNYGNKLVIGAELKNLIQANGFQINKSKSRLQTSNRRQEVTGLTVNNRLNVNRKYLSQLRAMLYAWEKFGLKAAEKEFTCLSLKKTVNRKLPLYESTPCKSNQRTLTTAKYGSEAATMA